MFLLGGITVLADHLVEILSVHMCPFSLRNLLSKRITAAQVVLLYRRESVFSCDVIFSYPITLLLLYGNDILKAVKTIRICA